MAELSGMSSPDWDLTEWEEVLTINVGAAYVCRECQNLVMVTRGGVGVMQLRCCGDPMEKVFLPGGGRKENGA